MEVGQKAELSTPSRLREEAGSAAAACAAELVEKQGKKGPVNEKKKGLRHTSQDLTKAVSQKEPCSALPAPKEELQGAVTKHLKLCLPKRNYGFASMAYILY